jgi:hypothetical protein
MIGLKLPPRLPEPWYSCAFSVFGLGTYVESRAEDVALPLDTGGLVASLWRWGTLTPNCLGAVQIAGGSPSNANQIGFLLV